MQVWKSYLKKDIETLKRVQRRATMMIKRKLSFEERLRNCKQSNLGVRRNRGELIETFKILTSREDLLPELIFKAITIKSRSTRRC